MMECQSLIPIFQQGRRFPKILPSDEVGTLNEVRMTVDDVDVREMSAVEVSKLISKKSDQGRRKLTIIRRTGGGGMY